MKGESLLVKQGGMEDLIGASSEDLISPLSASQHRIPLLFAFGPQSTCCSFCRTQGCVGVTGFFYHILQNCTPNCKLPTQRKDKATER